MKRIIYADNAATTCLSIAARNAMMRFLCDDYGNASQPYSFSRFIQKTLKEARQTIADCIGASPDEIFFTSCGTESDNWAIKGAYYLGRDIVTSQIEHHAILNSCKFVDSRNGKVSYIPVDNMGMVSITEIDALLSDGCLLSVMTANNELGTIEPIDELADIAHRHHAIFHTDAVQAIGHIPIDVHKMGIDMLSASAHKFNGPKGVGFLYVKSGLVWPSLIHGGSQERKSRAGTENVAGIVGMATALQENYEKLDGNMDYVMGLEKLLIDNLNEAGVLFNRNGSNNHIPGIVSLSFPNQSGESMLHRLDLKGICISTGSACDSHNTQVSHVLKSIHLDENLAKGTIRVSLGKYNTEEEVRTISTALIDISKICRQNNN